MADKVNRQQQFCMLLADRRLDARNLAWRAARLFLDAAGIADGVFVSVTKAVPSQAGMAGGSADAAGRSLGIRMGKPLTPSVSSVK